MKLIRVQMLKTRDQLQAGQWYNLPRPTALWLIEQGVAVGPEITTARPSEIKPAGPSEIKVTVKKKLSRAPTEKEF